MTDHSETSGHAPNSEDMHFVIDETKLPELIQGQIGKLNELDAGVKKALETAEKAELRAQAARKLSAGWSLFNDRKKEAIEGLQEVGVELAEAVQLGTHAQKISFELQARLAEVAKYLFALGVGNIAANRMVVRELEMRLHGASEKELSDLARQEVMSVVRQLKEQEDLLFKQEKMKEDLRNHNIKIESLLGRADHLERDVKDQHNRHHALASKVDTVEEASKQQKSDFSSLQRQNSVQQDEINTLTSSLEQVRYHVAESSKIILKQIDDLNSHLKDQGIQQQDLSSKMRGLQQQVFMQQKDLRWTVNVRTTLVVIWATAVSIAAYFLR